MNSQISLDQLLLPNSESSSSSENASSPPNSAFLQQLFKKLVAGTRSANALPRGDDLRYFHSFPQVRSATDDLSARVLSLLSRLMKSSPSAVSSLLADLPSDAARFEAIREAVDDKLEKVDLHLDAVLGLSTGLSVPSAGSSSAAAAKALAHASNPRRSSRMMLKPQRRFRDKVDNSNAPFIPLLRSKPNAVAPLPDYDALRLQLLQRSPDLPSGVAAHLAGVTQRRAVTVEHPYKVELEQLQFSADQLAPCKEQIYRSLDATPCHWIDTPEELRELADKLCEQSEIAIDLEHHSMRSYWGFLCLMQISTRTEDFLIDTLELRHELHILNSSFTDPSIVKVLHGADHDVMWLQRDLGLYLVNMFDTGQAARVLEFPRLGLGHLLQHFCDVATNKKLQLADWRERPLSAEKLMYARQDTHYLLYIYDRMRNSLLASPRANGTPKLMLATLNRSREICQRRYEKPQYDAVTDAQNLCQKYGAVLTEPKMRVLIALLRWRDETARTHDESRHYVMPNAVAMQVTQVLPMDSRALMQCCNPLTDLVRQNVETLVRLVTVTRADPKSPFLGAIAPPTDMDVDEGSGSAEALSLPSSRSSTSVTPKKRKPSPEQPSPVMSTEQLYQSAGWTHHPQVLQHTPLAEVQSRLFTDAAFDAELDSSATHVADEVRSSLGNPLQPFSTPAKRRRPNEEGVKESGLIETSPQPASLEAVQSPEKQADVPQSLREIYSVSNKNRHLNKKKKKKQRQVSGESVAQQAAAASANATATATDFMQEIGWMDEQSAAAHEAESNERQRSKSRDDRGSSRRRRGRNSSQHDSKNQKQGKAKGKGKAKFDYGAVNNPFTKQGVAKATAAAGGGTTGRGGRSRNSSRNRRGGNNANKRHARGGRAFSQRERETSFSFKPKGGGRS